MEARLLKIVSVPQCQHDDIRDCPLYHASHTGTVPGCCTGEWALGCAVARGEMSYAEQVSRIRWVHREWWQAFAVSVASRQQSEQRERNRNIK